ncbi:DoxX family protein [Paracrocinitomix mangrovi]|uniref:DoxX family protein n=1 Tax=Paracrocinitomix mangrovi TaxID=2862509 RepID=UPI001C8E0E63|nr:DoxX family protein [Paracrocinitomix mangrovi]UKN01586.1 DoxX family protein [Paracrocinitomix mangrovi]
MDDMRLRNQKPDVAGRSLLLNVIFVLLNVTGVVLTVIGFHESTSDSNSLVLSIMGMSLIAISLFVLFMLKGLFLFSYVARAFVGGLFIVSGLVKANDPWGFAFKLEEYFSPQGLTADYGFFGWFADYTLELSILICVAEIVLGAAVILGGKIKLASWSLLLMMIFFTWLTWYTASCNANQMLAMETGQEFTRDCVTDCGCFGDALRGSVGRSLTPYESFWKDIVLFYFVIIIFVNQWKINLNSIKENWIMVPASMVVIIFFSYVFDMWWFPIFFGLIALLGSFVIGNINIGKMAKPWKMAAYVSLLALIFSLYTSHYLPIKDYRAYAIGNNIKEQMSNGIPRISEWKFKYKNLQTGKEELFDASEYEVYGDTTMYEYVGREEIVIDPGKDPSITDFVATLEYEKLTDAEKKIPYVDSLFEWDYENYYEEKMILTHDYGADTIAALEYDTLFYPDSLYKAGDVYWDLIDPSAPWVIDMTQYLLNSENLLLMTIRDIENINEGSIDDFSELLTKSKEANIPFYVLSPATAEQISTFKSKYNFDATFMQFDGTEIKIIVRSNPGLVWLQNGTVKDKWPSRSIPDFDSIFEDEIENQHE